MPRSPARRSMHGPEDALVQEIASSASPEEAAPLLRRLWASRTARWTGWYWLGDFDDDTLFGDLKKPVSPTQTFSPGEKALSPMLAFGLIDTAVEIALEQTTAELFATALSLILDLADASKTSAMPEGLTGHWSDLEKKALDHETRNGEVEALWSRYDWSLSLRYGKHVHPYLQSRDVLVLIQILGTAWTDAADPATSAPALVAAPEALPLPYDSISGSDPPRFSLHAARTGAPFRSEDWPPVPPELPVMETVSFRATEPFRYGCVVVNPPQDGVVRVEFHWTPEAGAPERPGDEPNALLLRLGQWGRLRYNGSHTLGRTRSVERWVFNIGYFWYEAPRSAFTEGQPVAIYDQTAALH